MRSLVAAVALVILGALAPVASAREVYVSAFGANAVTPIDTQTKLAGTPIPVGVSPNGIAITPDGKTAYVADLNGNDVTPIDTQTAVPGASIKVGKRPRGIAVTPDGRFAYVADEGSGSVSTIDTQAGKVVGSAIPVGTDPISIAITPDGKTAYVTNALSNDVTPIDTQTRTAGTPITVGGDPWGIAITPDGKTAYVANVTSETVSPIDTATNTPGTPIPVGEGPRAVAITPDGATVYVTDQNSNDVIPIDTRTDTPGAPIKVKKNPEGIAITPNGKTAYVANQESDNVSVINTLTNKVVGAVIPVGATPGPVAIVPDQPPLASFTSAGTVAPGAPLGFDASASRDPDGQIAGYRWNFGDGQTASGGPVQTHTYAAAGTYQATLTLTDDEGCSTALLFTGQTAFCNGSALATATETVTVAAPAGPPTGGPVEPVAPARQLRVRVNCPKSAKPGGCKFALQVVSAMPKKAKGHKKQKATKPTAESAVAKIKLAAGKAALVTLTPKPQFAARLEAAAQLLVREVETAKGSTHTSYRRLKVVG
ncbi:MAG TPA: PKD domain-containing protein [Solirubrobacterales bacterium]